MYLFDQTLANVNQQYYLAASGSTTITVTLAGATFVTKLKIYPTANFQIWCPFVPVKELVDE
jgi:hypothetical protein